MNRRDIDSVIRSLRRVNFQRSFFGQTVAIRFGLSESDVDALELLIDTGAATAGRLSDLMGLTTGAVTRVIDRLEQAGYVRRLPDLDDRRGVVVELTQKGREAWDTSINVQGRREAFIASVLTKEEQRQLNHLLRKLLLGFGDEKGAKKERS